MVLEEVTKIEDIFTKLSKRNPARRKRQSTTPYTRDAKAREAERYSFFRTLNKERSTTPTIVAQGIPKSPITPRKQTLITNGVPVEPLKDVDTPTRHPFDLKTPAKETDNKLNRLYLLASIGAPDQEDNFREIYAPYRASPLVPPIVSDIQTQFPKGIHRSIHSRLASLSAESIHQAQHRPPRPSPNSVTGISSKSIFEVEGKLDLLSDRKNPANWGHLIADSLGGRSLPENLIPITAEANQKIMWPIVEHPLRDLLLTDTAARADYRLTPNYDPVSFSYIPEKLHAEISTHRNKTSDPETPCSTTTHHFFINPRSTEVLNTQDVQTLQQLWNVSCQDPSL